MPMAHASGLAWDIAQQGRHARAQILHVSRMLCNLIWTWFQLFSWSCYYGIVVPLWVNATACGAVSAHEHAITGRSVHVLHNMSRGSDARKFMRVHAWHNLNPCIKFNFGDQVCALRRTHTHITRWTWEAATVNCYGRCEAWKITVERLMQKLSQAFRGLALLKQMHMTTWHLVLRGLELDSYNVLQHGFLKSPRCLLFEWRISSQPFACARESSSRQPCRCMNSPKWRAIWFLGTSNQSHKCPV